MSLRAYMSDRREVHDDLLGPDQAVPGPAQPLDLVPPCKESEAEALRGPRRILVVDDDPSIRRVLEGLLAQGGYQVFTATNGKEAIDALNDAGPQIVITDWEMPVMDGLELCREIRRSETVGFVYAIILTSHGDRVVEAFDAGADDFLAKPPRRAELLARLKAAVRIVDLEARLARQNRQIHRVNAELTMLNERLKGMATTDELTGLANRRVMMDRLKHQWEAALRRNQPLSCLIMDVDNFKRFNDSYGHEVGDAVLKGIATTLARYARANEPVYRCGGEEFVVLLPDTTLEQATIAAERLRKAVEDSEFEHEGLRLKATVSVGVSQRVASFCSEDDLLRHADRAMYRAKADGRNCVRVARVEKERKDGVICEGGEALAHPLAGGSEWTIEPAP